MSDIKTMSPVDPSETFELGRQAKELEQAKSLAKQTLKSEAEIEKASSGFEALLLHQMLKAMWSTVDTTDLFGGNGNEAQIYRDMLNQAIADQVSEGQGIGVKDFLRKELSKFEGTSKG